MVEETGSENGKRVAGTLRGDRNYLHLRSGRRDSTLITPFFPECAGCSVAGWNSD